MRLIEDAPAIGPKTKVVAQVSFDEDKLREIVHEAIERFKEEYDIVDNPDAVSVVRCKDCNHRKKNGFCLEHNRYEKNDNGFCSYGERKESE